MFDDRGLTSQRNHDNARPVLLHGRGAPFRHHRNDGRRAPVLRLLLRNQARADGVSCHHLPFATPAAVSQTAPAPLTLAVVPRRLIRPLAPQHPQLCPAPQRTQWRALVTDAIVDDAKEYCARVPACNQACSCNVWSEKDCDFEDMATLYEAGWGIGFGLTILAVALYAVRVALVGVWSKRRQSCSSRSCLSCRRLCCWRLSLESSSTSPTTKSGRLGS